MPQFWPNVLCNLQDPHTRTQGQTTRAESVKNRPPTNTLQGSHWHLGDYFPSGASFQEDMNHFVFREGIPICPAHKSLSCDQRTKRTAFFSCLILFTFKLQMSQKWGTVNKQPKKTKQNKTGRAKQTKQNKRNQSKKKHEPSFSQPVLHRLVSIPLGILFGNVNLRYLHEFQGKPCDCAGLHQPNRKVTPPWKQKTHFVESLWWRTEG